MADDDLAHGPNPAVSAQPGVGIGGYSQPEYSPGADPYNTGEPAKKERAPRKAREQAPPPDEPDEPDDEAPADEPAEDEPPAREQHQSAGGKAGRRA
jgi:hypothetical protein